MSHPGRVAVLNKIKRARNAVASIDDIEDLRSAIFSFMDAASRTVLAAPPTSQPGWAATVKGEDGAPLWSPKEAELIEKVMGSMKGGADEDLTTQPNQPNNPIVKNAEEEPIKFSIDEIYYTIKNYFAQLDEDNKKLSEQFGALALVNDKKGDFGPYPPYVPFPISPRIVLPLVNTFLESLRLMVSIGPLQSGFLRVILSISTGIFELARGEWRNAVLSFLGVFGEGMVYVGAIGKVFRLVYGFMDPDIQDRLEDDMFKGGKSVFTGFWLWLFSLTAPALIRGKIVELHNTLKGYVDTYNERMASVKQGLDAQLAPLGLEADFKELDTDAIPSFDDIQSIQRMLHLPQIQCAQETQTLLAPLLTIPPLRLFLELAGITVSKEILEKQCTGVSRSLADALAKTVIPSIVPTKGGGAGHRRTRRCRKTPAKRKTRKQ